MRSIVLAVALAVAVLAGCGSGTEGVARQAAPPSPTTSEPPPFDREELSALTKKLLLPQEALLDVAGPTRAVDKLDGDFATSYFCNAYPANEGRTGHVAHERSWYAAFSVAQVAHGYYRKTGAEAVQEARAGVQRRCSSYAVTYFKTHSDDRQEAGDNVKYELLEPLQFDKPDGVEDAFGTCERETHVSGRQWIVCVAYLGRKNLATAIFATADQDEAATRAKLLQVIPKAAARLNAAATT
jgi:hypothetical protein